MTAPSDPTVIPPPDELRSERLLPRPYRADDADVLFAAIEESRGHPRPWMDWVDHHASVDDSGDDCLRCAANWLLRSDPTVGIFEATTGRFLGGTGLIDPLELRCDARNAASRRVAERVGFVLEGRLRNACLDPEGQPADDLLFSLIPGDLPGRGTAPETVAPTSTRR